MPTKATVSWRSEAAGIDEGDSYYLGEEPTGSGRVLVSDIPILEDVKVCEERLPPPPFLGCGDLI